MANENNELIYGKNPQTNVVGLEIQNNEARLFIQEADGSIRVDVCPNKFWILSNRQLGKNSHRLKGELHYKWAAQYNDKESFSKASNYHRKNYKDIYCIWDEKESFMVRYGVTMLKGLKPQEVSCLSFDIETTGLYHNADSKVLLISNTFRDCGGNITRRLFAYDDWDTQEDMIEAWCSWVCKMDPSFLLGHNIYSFDLPYLRFIMEQSGRELRLGRNGSPLIFKNRPSKFRVDGSRDQEYYKVRCYGREILDTMFLAIRHDAASKKYESHGLKSIIKAEGLEKADRVHYDSSQIRVNYLKPEEWKKIKTYCEHDADDSLALYDIVCPAFFYLTQSIPKSFQSIIESATGSQLNAMMVRAYLQNGHSIPKATPANSYTGAISFGIPGIYKNILKIDIHAMYPSILREYKYYNKEKDPNGYFLALVEYFALTRRQYKAEFKKTGNKYYDDLQSTMKIAANSLYGFLGTPGLNFNDPDGAAFVTKTGRDILDFTIQWATGKDANYWIEIFNEKTK